MKKTNLYLIKLARWLSPSIAPLANTCFDLSKGLTMIAFGYSYFKDETSPVAIVLTLITAAVLMLTGIVLFAIARNIEKDDNE